MKKGEPTDYRLKLDVENEEDCLTLQRLIARGEPLAVKGKPSQPRYKPLFKHPLHVSDHRHQQEALLRKIRSSSLDRQAAGAISLRNAWVLEEVYMLGAPMEVESPNGYRPIHLAAQLNDVECMMVLLNIGVDHDCPSYTGYTPRYIAHAAGSTQCEELLVEAGAVMHVWDGGKSLERSVIDLPGLGAGAKASAYRKVDKFLNLPDRHTSY